MGPGNGEAVTRVITVPTKTLMERAMDSEESYL